MRVPKNLNLRKFSFGKRLRPFFLLLVFQLMSVLLFAQEKKVEGTVSDSTGAPLEKVSVTVKSSKKGVATDAKGHYTIMAAPGAVITFSFTGYASKTAVVGADGTINVSLSSM